MYTHIAHCVPILAHYLNEVAPISRKGDWLEHFQILDFPLILILSSHAKNDIIPSILWTEYLRRYITLSEILLFKSRFNRWRLRNLQATPYTQWLLNKKKVINLVSLDFVRKKVFIKCIPMNWKREMTNQLRGWEE